MKPNSNSDFSKELSAGIRKKAKEIGLDLIGFSSVQELNEDRERLETWLDNGYNAGMSYMEKNLEKRTNPSLLVENSRSVIIAGLNYYQPLKDDSSVPRFSKYALGKDYHSVLKDMLYDLLEYIKSKEPGVNARVFVDSAPVLEKSLAVNSGLGWYGKNTMLINKELGSYLFLGEIISSIGLDNDEPYKKDHCGSCTKCIDACPTGAILDGKIIDSNKCISYLTIENRNEIPAVFRGKINGNVFGCDICQDVCPWNTIAKETMVDDFKPLPEIMSFSREQWENITEDQFNSIFCDSPVQRAGYEGFKRNLSFLSRILGESSGEESPNS